MFKSFLTALALVFLLPYACAPVYRFDPPRPFTGTEIYNPYGSAASLPWRRANLHAHGRAWLGVTSAHQSDAEVAAAYKARGYDIVAISDYQRIAVTGDSTLPVYEHGYNAGKHHQLAIGARRVAWFDLPLWQGVNQKQYVINRVAETSALVALAHPSALQGYAYSQDELEALTGYQLMEFVNGRFTTESSWDSALSAGRPAWGIGDDDTHDVTDTDRFAVAWNMIAARSTAAADIVDALRRGRTYVVRDSGSGNGAATTLAGVDVRDGVITVTCTGPQAQIAFIGQDGVVKRTVNATATATYTVAPDDSYIRTVVRGPSQTLFLNPLIRFDGRALPAPVATIDALSTWVQRIALLAVCALLAGWIVRRHASRRGGGGTDEARPWRRVASYVVVFAAALAAPTAAQEPPPAPLPSTVSETTPFETAFDATLLNALPIGDSVFTLLETAVPEAISDRISTGGIGFASAPHVSVFGSSITQTRFRVGDVDITDPSSGGTPMVVPELLFWQRVSISTGLGSPTFATPGAAVALEPRRPAAAWTASVDASSSFGDALTATPSTPPAISRLAGWNRGSVLASGPVVPDRAGLVVAAAVTHAAQRERAAAASLDGDVVSAFANLVVAASPRDEVRTVGWVQRTTFPTPLAALFSATQPSLDDTSVHVQSTWAHGDTSARPWRIFAGYSQRNRAPQSPLTSTATIERLNDGPPTLVAADTGARTDRRASAGARASGRHGIHALEVGADLEHARAATEPGFGGVVGELVDGVPARAWRYAAPDATSRRASTTVSAFADDRIAISDHATLDVSLRFEHLSASADGAPQAISWSTFLPRAMYRSTLSAAHRVDWFVGGGISAYQLPLDMLAWGDPAAPSIDVFRWTGGAPAAAATTPRLLNVGPGATGRIDPDLARPYADDLTFGVQARPRTGLAIELAGLCRWEKNLFGVGNVSPNAPVFTRVNVADPGLDLPNPADDQVLGVFDLALPTGGSGFDNVLTNPPDATARRLGAKLTTEYTAERLYILFGATAYAAEGVASSRGFLSRENDQGLVGEDPMNPNAVLYDRGRLFGDRAFTGKLSAVYRFPAGVTLGAIARYHDGQPFARLVIVPDLNQGPEIVRAFANGGSRFTFTATLDVRLQKSFDLEGRRVAAFIDGYNLTNRADEVEERTVSGAGFRTPTAFQPPRTLRVGARVEF